MIDEQRILFFLQAGFFKRKEKDEMAILANQGPVEPEAENLNSGNN